MIKQELLLKWALILSGVGFLLIYPMAIVWPSGWSWHHGKPSDSQYFLMIVAVYATLGVFLIRAAGNPQGNRSLIWFTVWSSLVHAAIMGVQSMDGSEHRGHLLGDVPALVLIAIILGALIFSNRHATPP